MNHGLDTDTHVFFYEQDFYVLSNFSSFNLKWKGHTFATSEHAYHWEKFDGVPGATNVCGELAWQVLNAPSAHEAFSFANGYKTRRRPDWDAVKVDIMREILRAKAQQHEYVRRKLLATGDRVLVENSWRDDYWGWGQDRTGQNMLGRLWMEVRGELRAVLNDGAAATAPSELGRNIAEYRGAKAAPSDEHPAARRMRERFEGKYGDLSDVMRAASGWRKAWADWQRPFNHAMEQPVTEEDVEAAEMAMLAAVRSLANVASAANELGLGTVLRESSQ